MTEDRFGSAVSAVAGTADLLNETAAANTDGGGIGGLPWEAASRHLSALRDAVTTLLQIDAALVRHLYLTAPHGDTELEGVGVVKVYRSNDRKDWDHETWQKDVRGALLERKGIGPVLADPVSGELIEVLDLLRELQDVHGAQAPKVTRLRALGLEPGAYCEERPGKPSVQITRPSG